MAIVNFYYINEDIPNFTYNLIYQLVVKNNKKVMVYSSTIEKVQKFSDFLWNSCKGTDFLPHSVIDDELITDKLILSNKLENKYNQEYLLLSSFINDEDFLKTFEKIFIISNNKEDIKKNIDFYKNFEIVINAKKDKWFVVDNVDNL